jgi:CubicO group peptidase (beta-lactamase class C family)
MAAKLAGILFALSLLMPVAGQAVADEPAAAADFDAATQRLAQELRAKNFTGIIDASITNRTAFRYASPGIDTSSIFWVGSVSKQFAAAAALRLVDQGKLVLDEPFAARLNLTAGALTRNGRACSVAQVLNHTCGLPKGNTCAEFDFADPRTRPKFLKCVAGIELESEPGAKYEYSNVGYDLIGVLVAVTTQQDYAEFLRREFFAPLGMNSTGVSLTQNPQARARLIQGRAFCGLGFAKTSPWLLLRADVPAGMGASGNIYSTVDDLHTWNRALHGGRILGAATYRRMITPVLEDYGFGVAAETSKRGVQWIWHNGSIAPMGWSSFVAYIPSLNASVVGLANRSRHTSHVMNATKAVVLALVGDEVSSPMLKAPDAKAYALEMVFFVVPALCALSVLLLMWYFVLGPRGRPMRWLLAIDLAALMFLFTSTVFAFSRPVIWLALVPAVAVAAAVARHRKDLNFSIRDTWRNAKERNAALSSLFAAGVLLLVASSTARLLFAGVLAVEGFLIFVFVTRRRAAKNAV